MQNPVEVRPHGCVPGTTLQHLAVRVSEDDTHPIPESCVEAAVEHPPSGHREPVLPINLKVSGMVDPIADVDQMELMREWARRGEVVLAACVRLGIDLGQGWVFGRPRSAGDPRTR
jgi:hypothetical protein